MDWRKGLLAGAGVALGGGLALRRRRVLAPGITGEGPRPRVVVAGAGFAGVSFLSELHQRLRPDEVEVTLIDQHNYHLFTPLLYQVATGSVDAAHVAFPLRPFCHRLGVNLLTTSISNVNLIDRVVETGDGPLPYDYLILGLGSQTNYFGMKEVEERTQGLKSIGDANAIRRSVIENIEEAATTEDPAARRRLLTFVIVGAGATGVELVASMHELIHHNLLPYYPRLDPGEARIVMIEATDQILPGVDERMRAIAMARLTELGIDLRLQTAVSGVEDGAVLTREGGRVPSATAIWTAGIRPNPVTASMAVEKSRDGRIVVDDCLRIPAHSNVFVLGDAAAFRLPGAERPLPPNAQAAVQEGPATARNIAHLLRGEPIMPFEYHPHGDLIALGRARAAAQIGTVVYGGFPAWVTWRGYYLTQLMGMKNRTGVAFDWISSLASRRYIADIEL